jgi:hypothetical protein
MSARIILAFCLALAIVILGAPVKAQERVALVIGNGSYAHATVLPNPPNDAADISASLTRLGFQVRTLNNAGFDAMRIAFRDFAREAQGADMAVVYFAGHGLEIGGENYLVPVDAQMRSDRDIEHEAVALRSVMNVVSGARRLGLVMLDACRNDPFRPRMTQSAGLTRTVTRGLGRVEPRGNLLVAFAAREGTVADDGRGRNSPFTASLLRHLETPGQEINFLFRRVRDEVLNATSRAQEPATYGSLGAEEIFLVPGRAPMIAAAPAVAPLQAPTLSPPQELSLAALAPPQPSPPIAAVLRPEAAPTPAAARPAPTTRQIFIELRRVGCASGEPPTGWNNEKVRGALRRYASVTGTNSPAAPTTELLDALRAAPGRVCSAEAARPPRARPGPARPPQAQLLPGTRVTTPPRTGCWTRDQNGHMIIASCP